MINLINENKLNTKKINFYGYDLFENLITRDIKTKEFIKMPPIKKVVFDTINKCNNVNINLIEGNTNTTLPIFYKNNPEFKADFIYIDGGHALETVENDWNYCSKFMHKETIVLFDDYCIFPDNYDGIIWGSKITIDNIDRNIYNVEISKEFDIFSNRKHYQATVTLKP